MKDSKFELQKNKPLKNHLIKFKGENKSHISNLNLLFVDGKSYVMDNHLAAGWCWLQTINLKNKYNLFHIDRHYDLMDLNDLEIEYLKQQNFYFKSISIEKLLEIKFKI